MTVKELKSFYELERERLDKKIQDEREKADKKVKKAKEDFEQRLSE